MGIDWDNLKDIEKCKTDVCGGFKCCKDRTYDKYKSDCQECLADADKAMSAERSTRKELGKLWDTVKERFNNFIKKITKRIHCSHSSYTDVVCTVTGLYMYKRCTECGKKKY